MNLEKIKKVLNASQEVAAAYLFGSVLDNMAVANDVDILVLLYPDINSHNDYFDLADRLAKDLEISPEKVDILFFDLRMASPEVLYHATNKGVLLKNASLKRLIRENLGEYCANRS